MIMDLFEEIYHLTYYNIIGVSQIVTYSYYRINVEWAEMRDIIGLKILNHPYKNKITTLKLFAKFPINSWKFVNKLLKFQKL